MTYVNHYQETTLAWSLAELAAARLPRGRRAQVFARIGAGDVQPAILSLLECCHRHGVPVPLQVWMSLRDWLDGYAGTEVEATFRPHIERIAAAVGDTAMTFDLPPGGAAATPPPLVATRHRR
ncbi:hypothetical protein P3H80_32625 [Mycolicibacterium septicum]|uniref:hypothetical protein n=1 Tax=Mycolicibacterium septicum TaxID=98668 RepID=UPI0023E33895|nr:hypothetical protein [Mycolicibacterium septicum]MDF3342206.1 hypothetical protein [Mycolicibacterium septicum]